MTQMADAASGVPNQISTLEPQSSSSDLHSSEDVDQCSSFSECHLLHPDRYTRTIHELVCARSSTCSMYSTSSHTIQTRTDSLASSNSGAHPSEISASSILLSKVDIEACSSSDVSTRRDTPNSIRKVSHAAIDYSHRVTRFVEDEYSSLQPKLSIFLKQIYQLGRYPITGSVLCGQYPGNFLTIGHGPAASKHDPFGAAALVRLVHHLHGQTNTEELVLVLEPRIQSNKASLMIP